MHNIIETKSYPWWVFLAIGSYRVFMPSRKSSLYLSSAPKTPVVAKVNTNRYEAFLIGYVTHQDTFPDFFFPS